MSATDGAADPYQIYAHLYDELKGERRETIRVIQELMAEHSYFAHDVLELACGTGGILAGFTSGLYNLAGLDISPAMLAQARQKLPDVSFTKGDMTNFDLHKKFDVIYCVHNSVNHLLNFSQWEAMFHHVATQLYDRGLFIFDVSTPEKLDELMRLPAGGVRLGQEYIIAKVEKGAPPERYDWHLDVFLRRPDHAFTLHQEIVPLSAFSVARIQKALAANFVVNEVRVLDGARNFDDKNRAFFACTKKASSPTGN